MLVCCYENNPDMARQYVKMNGYTFIEVERSLFANGFCTWLMCNDHIGTFEFFPLKRDAVKYARDASRILSIPFIHNGKVDNNELTKNGDLA